MPKAKAKTHAELIAELFAAMPPNYCDEHVGQRIAKRRKEIGISQSDLARSGYSVASISLVENGYRVPPMHQLFKMSLALNISFSYLARGEEPQELKAREQRYIFLFMGVKSTDLNLSDARKRELGKASK
jgi:transcriptional regulator with XRE-family HTH domain